MRFDRQFVIAAGGLALLGIVALAVTGQVGMLYLAFAVGAVGWVCLRGWQGRTHGIDSRIANTISAGAMVALFAPVFFRGAPPIEAIAEFLLVLTALRVLAATNARDWLQIYALSFFQVVAASALTIEPVFALVFVVYLLLAPWALVLLSLRRELVESGQGRRLVEERFVDLSLFRSVAGVTLVLFFSTLTVFVFFPRMGAGFFASPLATGQALTGFSDEIGLGDVTALKSDGAIAMRITTDRPERLRNRHSYWRGSALDSFDGRRWRRGRLELHSLSRVRPGLFLVSEGSRARDFARHEIILEPRDHPTIFFIGRPLHVQGRFGNVMLDELGNLRVITAPGARLRYEVLSSMSRRTTQPTARSRKLPPVDPRVVDLAHEIIAGNRGDAAGADALLGFFRKGFRYTTTPGDPGDADPLARFLFETRTGHCEYFASALAVMFRAVGIPSLVVNGYLGNEWNEFGEYLVVRQSDAHSWVEAYVDGEWRMFDPTPPTGQGLVNQRFTSFAAMLDAYRMRWYRYVVNYSLQDQVELALQLRSSSHRLWSGDTLREMWARLRGSERGSRETPWAVLFGALAVAVVAALLWRRGRGRQPTGEDAWATARYRAMLGLLERRGLRKQPGETADEFLDKIESRLDGDRDVVARLTALYQEARFSGHESPDQRAEIESLLGTLEERR